MVLAPLSNLAPLDAHASAGTVTIANTQSTQGTVSSSPFQFTISNFNVGTGNDRLLLVGISANNQYATSVTFNGVSLTRAVSSFSNNDAEFWYLKNPSGTGNVVVTMNGATSAVIGAYAFSGVNQTSSIATTAINHNTVAGSPTIPITTKYQNDLVVDLPSIYGGVTLGSHTCTQSWDLNVPSGITGASSTLTASSPGTVTCSWTASGSGDMWDDVAIEISAAASSVVTPPSAPQNLVATGANGQVSLSWTAPSSDGGSAITSYNIYRGITSGSEVKVTSISASSTFYTDTGLTNGQQYFYEITSSNSAGESAKSNEASATPKAPTTPSVPQNLQATTVSSSQINLVWSAPSSNGGSPITGYEVERAQGDLSFGKFSNSTSATFFSEGNTTSLGDTGLAYSTTYNYTVFAKNSAGTSQSSNDASATTSANNPPPPQGIKLNNVQSTFGTTSSSNQMTIASFNTGSGTNQMLLVGLSANNQYATSVTFNGVSLTRAVSSFSNNDAEFWYLKNPSGTGNVVVTMNGVTSAVVGAYALSGVNQTNPIAGTSINFNPTGTASSPTVQITTKYSNDLVADLPSIYGGVTLSFPTCTQQWYNNVPNAITGGSSTLMVSSPGTVTCSWTASRGDQWDDVALEVRASGSAPPNTPPSAPTGLTATGGNTQVSLSWTAPTSNGGSATTGYNIYRSATAGTEVKVASATATSTTYTDTGLTNGQKYFYEVTAVNAIGESVKSNEANATPTPTQTPPSAPTGLVATGGNTQATLSWTPPSSNGGSPITNYKIYRSTTAGTEALVATAGNVTSYTDTGLTNGQQYFYEITAVNAIGESVKSTEASATPQPANTPPSAPTGLAAIGGNAQISLSWTAPSNNGGVTITSYNIYRGTTSGGEVQIASAPTTTYTDAGLTNGQQYFYKVTAVNSIGESAKSNEASATPQSSTCSGTGPTMCINTNSVNVGTDVLIKGIHFAPNSQVTISLDGTAYGIGQANIDSGSTTPSQILTDSSGNFVVIVQTLRSTAGVHTLSAQDASANKASQQVTVTPHALLFPTTVRPGSTVMIPASQGNGFAASATMTVQFDNSPASLGPLDSTTPTSTDTAGNFGGIITIPNTAATGQHQITISDGKGDVYTTSINVDPNAHSYSYQTVYSGVPNVPGNNNFLAYFAFIPDNGPGVDGSGAFMANEKDSGRVDVFSYTNGKFVEQSVPFVTVSKLQTAGWAANGLLGVAFDPRWATSPSYQWVYLAFTSTVGSTVQENLVRYHAIKDSSGDIVEDPAYGQQALVTVSPVSSNDHNGGSLKFDLNGNLYWSVGDAWQFTPAQDLTSPLGKILRITPVYGSQVNNQWYTIPASNPFASSTNAVTQMVWTYGVRHAYDFDVDQKTGKIYLSDVGFNTWERIDNATLGGTNQGWPNYESPIGSNPNGLNGYTPQIYWYSHQGVEPQTGPSNGLEALTAGAFYHGTVYPNMDGAYFFGDFGVGMISALYPSSTASPIMDPVHGVPKGNAVPILYGLSNFAPIFMQEWNGRMYSFDLNGNFNVLNYN